MLDFRALCLIVWSRHCDYLRRENKKLESMTICEGQPFDKQMEVTHEMLDAATNLSTASGTQHKLERKHLKGVTPL